MPKQDSILLPSDEGLNHQVAETFATVAQSDPAWTEKLWGAVFKKDGSLGVGFGLGKYMNRNVMDAYCGVSRGVEQWAVRGSRMLFPDPDLSSVGPIHYEIIEPLKRLRVRLEENDSQPISFDITLHCDDRFVSLEERAWPSLRGAVSYLPCKLRRHPTLPRIGTQPVTVTRNTWRRG